MLNPAKSLCGVRRRHRGCQNIRWLSFYRFFIQYKQNNQMNIRLFFNLFKSVVVNTIPYFCIPFIVLGFVVSFTFELFSFSEPKLSDNTGFAIVFRISLSSKFGYISTFRILEWDFCSIFLYKYGCLVMSFVCCVCVEFYWSLLQLI